MTIWTKDFAIALLERVVATFIFTLAGTLTAEGFDFQHAPWKEILIAAGVAAVLSVAKGLIANGVTKNGPSVTSSEQVFPPEPQPTGNPGPSVDEPDAVG